MATIPSTHPQIRVQFPNGLAAIANRLKVLRDTEQFSLAAEAAQALAEAARDAAQVSADTADTHRQAAATSATAASDSAQAAAVSEQKVYKQGFAVETASFTVSATHLDKYVKCESVTDINVTIPHDTTENLEEGRSLVLRRRTAAQVIVTPEANVLVNGTLAVPEQHSSLVLMKVGPNEWDVS